MGTRLDFLLEDLNTKNKVIVYNQEGYLHQLANATDITNDKSSLNVVASSISAILSKEITFIYNIIRAFRVTLIDEIVNAFISIERDATSKFKFTHDSINFIKLFPIHDTLYNNQLLSSDFTEIAPNNVEIKPFNISGGNLIHNNPVINQLLQEYLQNIDNSIILDVETDLINSNWNITYNMYNKRPEEIISNFHYYFILYMSILMASKQYRSDNITPTAEILAAHVEKLSILIYKAIAIIKFSVSNDIMLYSIDTINRRICILEDIYNNYREQLEADAIMGAYLDAFETNRKCKVLALKGKEIINNSEFYIKKYKTELTNEMLVMKEYINTNVGITIKYKALDIIKNYGNELRNLLPIEVIESNISKLLKSEYLLDQNNPEKITDLILLNIFQENSFTYLFLNKFFSLDNDNIYKEPKILAGMVLIGIVTDLVVDSLATTDLTELEKDLYTYVL